MAEDKTIEINLQSSQLPDPLEEFNKQQTKFVNTQFMAQYGKNTATYGKLYAGGSTTITTTTAIKVTLNTEAFSNGVTADNTNSKLIVETTGYYQLNATVYFTSVLDGNYYELMIYKNGVELARGRSLAGASLNCAVTLSDIVSLTAADYLEMYVFQQSGSTAGISAGEAFTRLSIHKL